MSNPYKPKKIWVHAKSGNPVGDGPMPYVTKAGTLQYSDSTRLSDNSGEMNAVNKKDLINAITSLQKAVASGGVREVDESANDSRKKELVMAAVQDKDGPAFKALGEVIGDAVSETLGRQAFAAKTLLKKPLAQGEIGRIRIRKKDVLCFFATRNPEVIASQVRQFYAYPPEYYLLGRILAEDAEIEQAAADFLDQKYEDGVEAILRQQDLVWKRLVDASATAYNSSFLFNTFTPTVFANMQNQVLRWGIPVDKAIIAFDIWPDITADTEFSTFLDPVSKHEVVLTGYLGNIMGTSILTDGYRYDTLKVLNAGEVYFVGAPQTLGARTVRKELSSAVINLYNLGRPERGFLLEAIEGMVISNPRAVVKGNRI